MLASRTEAGESPLDFIGPAMKAYDDIGPVEKQSFMFLFKASAIQKDLQNFVVTYAR